MNLIQLYAIVTGGVFGVLLLLNGWPWITRFIRYLSPLMSKYMVYRYVLHRHRLLGPCSLVGVLLQLIYFAGNITCFSLMVPRVQTQTSTLSQAGLRAGTLSIINLIPLFAGPHLGTLADLLGVNLRTIRQIHRSAGIMAFLLVGFHTLVVVGSRSSFALDEVQNLFAVIGASSLACIILLSIPIFRRLSYELFLRAHQALSVLVVYAIWRHIPSNLSFPRYSLYVLVGLFIFSCIVQGVIILWQNGFFRPGRAQAEITQVYGAVRLRIQCRKPLKVKAGQYINLWIPSVSFWSFLQSHPFVVISWAEKPQDHLDLFIEPRRGLTRKLLYHAQKGRTTHLPLLFSGPHGKSIYMDDYEKILMIASDFGIAAQLPYLKRLIRGYNERQLRARRVHLVWQVRDINVTVAAETLLNGALGEDTLDDGWVNMMILIIWQFFDHGAQILNISIYCELDDIPRTSFGKRAHVYPGPAPLRDIVQAEITGEQVQPRPVQQVDWNTQRVVDGNEIGTGSTIKRDGKMLITVSTANGVWDELRKVVRDHLADEVQLFELDYQPL